MGSKSVMSCFGLRCGGGGRGLGFWYEEPSFESPLFDSSLILRITIRITLLRPPFFDWTLLVRILEEEEEGLVGLG